MPGPTKIHAPTKDAVQRRSQTTRGAARPASASEKQRAGIQLRAPAPPSAAAGGDTLPSHPEPCQRAFGPLAGSAGRARVAAAGRAGVQRAAGDGQRQSDAAAAGGESISTDDVRRAAVAGTRGPGQALPYLSTIQRSFGRHDISHIVAHTGHEAAAGARAMGATAFATGHHIAFAGPPDLRTAAHEAAHVVQQQGGIQLKGGVGEVGDPHEQHADAVAEVVAAGRSAEGLLDRYVPQRRSGEMTRGETATAPWTQKTAARATPVPQNPVGNVVQRNLGFEFQTFKEGGSRDGSTGFKEYKTPRRGTRSVWTKLNDHAVYAKGSDWHVESDGGDLEVVTDHTKVTEDAKGRRKLGEILDSIESTLANVPTTAQVIGKDASQVDSIATALPGLTLTGTGTARDNNGVRLIRTREVYAHPQATLGLKLDKLLEMMELISKSQQHKVDPTEKERLAKQVGWYHGDEAERLRKNVESSADKARAYVASLKDPKITDKFTGFLALVSSYILGGSAPAEQVYGKNVTPFMSRSNLVSVFGSMSDNERKYFRYMVSTPKAMSELAKAMAWPIVTTRSDPSSLFKEGTREGSASVRPETKFPIADWLTAITREVRPADRLVTTTGPDPDHPDRGTERTFRGFGTMGLDGDKTVVELRKLKGKVKLADWKTFALNMFDLLTLVNHGKRMVGLVPAPAPAASRVAAPLPGPLPAPIPVRSPAPIPAPIPNSQ